MKTFEIVTFDEPYKVIDLNNGGVSYFENKLDAYKMAVVIASRGHNYRIEFDET